MTSEISSAPELIYYCEFDPENWDDRLEITFSNEHVISFHLPELIDSKIHIHLNIQSKKLEKSKHFFGENISNATVIVGKNGAGKTSLLKNIMGQDQGDNRRNSFTIYTDRHFGGTYKVFSRSIKTSFEINGVNRNSKQEIGIPCFILDVSNNKNYINKINKTDRLINLNDISRWEFMISDEFLSYFKADITSGISLEVNPIDNDIRATFLRDIVGNLIDKWDVFKKNNNDSSQSKFILLFMISFLVDLFKEIDEEYCIFEKSSIDCGDKLSDGYYEGMEDNERKKLSDELDFWNNQSDELDTFIQSIDFDFSSDISIERLKKCIESLLDRYQERDKKIELDRIIGLFKKIPSNFFSSNRLKVLGRSNYIENKEVITSLFIALENFNKNHPRIFISTVGGLSSGEQQLIDTFSILRQFLRLLQENEGDTICFLLDEPDARLHPEWARRFLYYCLSFLSFEAQKLKMNFQLLLATHSPYIISDLPKENIRLIHKDEKTGKRKVSKPKHSFASNYYDILSDSFFLEDTIGEFAKQKINGWITELNELENSSAFGSDFAKLTRIDELKELINIVDDQFIRNKLLELAEDVKGRIEERDDKDLQKYLLDQQIAELQKRRKALDLEDNDD